MSTLVESCTPNFIGDGINDSITAGAYMALGCSITVGIGIGPERDWGLAGGLNTTGGM